MPRWILGAQISQPAVVSAAAGSGLRRRGLIIQNPLPGCRRRITAKRNGALGEDDFGAYAVGIQVTLAHVAIPKPFITLASRSTVWGLGIVIVRCTALFGASLIAFALSRNLWLSMFALMCAGFGIMVTTAAMNTVIQTLVEENMRGRVMALYTMAFIGLSPVGGLMGGALADRVGAPVTGAIGGVCCIGLALWFWRQLPPLREMVRPIYQRMGIIPEVAVGLQTVSEVPPHE